MGRNSSASVTIAVGPAGEQLPDCHERAFVERYLADGSSNCDSHLGLPRSGGLFFCEYV